MLTAGVLDRLEQDDAWLRALRRDCRLESDGNRQVFDAGHGRCVLFVPMLGELNVLYVPQMRALASSGFREITYVPIVKTTGRLTVQDRVDELVSVLDALGLASCDLVAWSDTGAVAHRFAMQHSGRVHSTSFVVVPDRYRLPLMLRGLLKPLSSLPIEHFVPAALVRWVLGSYMGGPRVTAQVVRKFAKRIPRLCAVFKCSCLPCIEEHDATTSGEVPTSLVIVGTASKVVAAEQAEALRLALRSREKLVLIDGGEHLATYANSAEVTSAVLDFIGRTHQPRILT